MSILTKHGHWHDLQISNDLIIFRASAEIEIYLLLYKSVKLRKVLWFHLRYCNKHNYKSI